MDKMGLALKTFFLFIDLLLWAGIWLTGFDVVHWVLYIPAIFMLIAPVTGVCPGIIFLKKIYKEDSSKFIE